MTQSIDLDWLSWDTDTSDDVREPLVPPSQVHTLRLPPERRDWSLWTPNVFSLHNAPYGAMLEPRGYEIMRLRKKRTVEAYIKYMPVTARLAQAIFDTIPYKNVWGEHRITKKIAGDVTTDQGFAKPRADASWRTITAGKWVEIAKGTRKGRGFQMQPMALLDVIKTLASPDHYALGSRDAWDWPLAYLPVRHARIDIDMDSVFEREDLEALQAQIAQTRAVFGCLGLSCGVMRTGNRGIQAIATIPPMPLHVASVLIHALRYVLKGAKKWWHAKDFQSNLDGLMRLPLGRHALTGNVAWMLDEDANVLPLACQGQAVHSALAAPSTMPGHWIEEVLSFLCMRDFARHRVLEARILPTLAECMPKNGLVEMLKAACDQFGIAGVLPARTASVPLSIQTPQITEGPLEETESEAVRSVRSHIPVDVRRAKEIFNRGYNAGASYCFFMNKIVDGKPGQNGIGLALIISQGDVAKAISLLTEQARRMPARSEADISARIRLIEALTPRNDTYSRLQKILSARKHRALEGAVLPEETQRAIEIVEHLVEQRRTSSCRIKAFQPKALMTIQHVVELLQMEQRCSPDGIISVSFRTLAAEICVRWPNDETNAVDVSRQMAWIMSGPRCLYRVVETMQKPASNYASTTYRLTNDFITLTLS